MYYCIIYMYRYKQRIQFYNRFRCYGNIKIIYLKGIKYILKDNKYIID